MKTPNLAWIHGQYPEARGFSYKDMVASSDATGLNFPVLIDAIREEAAGVIDLTKISDRVLAALIVENSSYDEDDFGNKCEQQPSFIDIVRLVIVDIKGCCMPDGEPVVEVQAGLFNGQQM